MKILLIACVSVVVVTTSLAMALETCGRYLRRLNNDY